ncbi:MAG: hypothetical protein ACRD82_05165, partial [Blastocatellia bacterium]
FEERYFTDDEVFDRLLIVKADLIDRCLHGQLSEEQANKFESFFLQSHDHRHEVALVRSLLNQNSAAKPFAAPPAAVKVERASWMERLFGASPAWARLAAGMLAALLIAGFVWMMMDNRRMRAELNALRAQQQTATRREQELRQSLAALQTQSQAPMQTPILTTSPTPDSSPSPRKESLLASVFPITLAPGQSRNSGASQEERVPAGMRKIQLRLLLDQDFDYSRYAVALKNASDRTIQTRAGLRVTSNSSGDAIEVEFSADKLKSGDYTATLSGIPAKGRMEEIADYHFRIERR